MKIKLLLLSIFIMSLSIAISQIHTLLPINLGEDSKIVAYNNGHVIVKDDKNNKLVTYSENGIKFEYPLGKNYSSSEFRVMGPSANGVFLAYSTYHNLVYRCKQGKLKKIDLDFKTQKVGVYQYGLLVVGDASGTLYTPFEENPRVIDLQGVKNYSRKWFVHNYISISPNGTSYCYINKRFFLRVISKEVYDIKGINSVNGISDDGSLIKARKTTYENSFIFKSGKQISAMKTKGKPNRAIGRLLASPKEITQVFYMNIPVDQYMYKNHTYIVDQNKYIRFTNNLLYPVKNSSILQPLSIQEEYRKYYVLYLKKNKLVYKELDSYCKEDLLPSLGLNATLSDYKPKSVHIDMNSGNFVILLADNNLKEHKLLFVFFNK